MATKRLPDKYCPCCDRVKSITQFIKDYRQNKVDDYLPICKKCVETMTKTIGDQYGIVVGVWTVAMQNGVPMMQKAWKRAQELLKMSDNTPPFIAYYAGLKDTIGEYSGIWQSDCWFGTFVTPKEVAETTQIGIKEYSTDELQQIFIEWGKFTDNSGGIDYDAYEFLIPRYENYVKDVNGLTDAMSMQYKNLCKAEWQKIKADESGDISAIDKAQKLVNGLLGVLKLDDFAVEKSDTDRFIDRLIWRIEETEPAEIEDESKYVDVAGHEKTYHSIMRSLRNIIANSRDFPAVPPEEL